MDKEAVSHFGEADGCSCIVALCCTIAFSSQSNGQQFVGVCMSFVFLDSLQCLRSRSSCLTRRHCHGCVVNQLWLRCCLPTYSWTTIKVWQDVSKCSACNQSFLVQRGTALQNFPSQQSCLCWFKSWNPKSMTSGRCWNVWLKWIRFFSDHVLSTSDWRTNSFNTISVKFRNALILWCRSFSESILSPILPVIFLHCFWVLAQKKHSQTV